MQRQTLLALRAAQSAGKAVVLLSALDGSAQQLLDLADAAGLSPELAAAVALAISSDRAQRVLVDEREWLLTPYNPPLRLVIIGAVHISEFLARMAQQLGYAVTVVDPRAGFARADLFAGSQLVNEWPQVALPALALDARCAVVLLTHDPKIDDPALQHVLHTPVFYIGALGSTRTHARRLERLAEQGFDAVTLARIHGPAGLNIGARTPAEIAVSVLAQMIQALRQAVR